MRTTERSSYTADPDLRARLQAFTPDEPGVVFPFSARLAQEQGWTREHARRVMREYLRFVYLAATAGHPVTPSKQVDEAWHLHLTYTRSYWDELCGHVLRRPLHHEPTRGGAEEEGKFAGWYLRTLESYRAAFGEDPPANIWPRPGSARGTAPAAKPRIRPLRTSRGGTAATLLAGGVLAAGCFGTARADTVVTVAIFAAVVLMGWLTYRAVPGSPVHGQATRGDLRPARQPENGTHAMYVDPGGVYASGGDGSTDSGCDPGSGGSDGGSDAGCGDAGSSCGSGCGSGCGGGE